MDPPARKPLSRGADAELHVSALVGFLELKQSVVIVHSDVVGIAFNPALGNMSAFGSDPLELHCVLARWGVRSRATFDVVAEVGREVNAGSLPCVSMLGFQKAHSELLGSFHIVLAIMNTMSGG